MPCEARVLPVLVLSLLASFPAAGDATDGFRIVAEGPHAGFGETLVLGPGARLRAELPESHAGVRPEVTFDGEPVTLESWTAGREPARHEIEGSLTGPDGTLTLEPFAVLVDPTPPRVQRAVGDLSLLEEHGLDQGVEPRRPWRVESHRDVPVYWSADGRRWLPLLPPDREDVDWVLEGAEPQLFLWIRKDGALHLEDGTPIRRGEVVRVWAADELSAVERLVVSVTPATTTFVVRDLVGNEARVVWGLGR